MAAGLQLLCLKNASGAITVDDRITTGRAKGDALALDSNPTLPMPCKLRQILKMALSFSVAIFKLGINTSAS